VEEINQVPPIASSARVLHGFLLGGSICILVAMALIVKFMGSRLGSASFAEVFGMIFAVVALINILIGVVLFRPKIPKRQPDQSADDYWPEAMGRAMMVWVFAEGGCIIASLGYLMSGTTVTWVVALTGIGILMWLRPGQLDRQHTP